MLKRKEILRELKKIGFDKSSELKSGCRDYERYFQVTLLKQVLEGRKHQALS